MKTKTLLLGALLALTVYSCSSEREEQEQAEVSKKVELNALKTSNNQEESSKVSDSINGSNHLLTPLDSGNGLDPTIDPNPDPNEGGDPTTITPPKR